MASRGSIMLVLRIMYNTIGEIVPVSQSLGGALDVHLYPYKRIKLLSPGVKKIIME